MYMDVATMTLEQLANITSMLSQARLSAYMENMGNRTFLFAIPSEEFNAALGLNIDTMQM